MWGYAEFVAVFFIFWAVLTVAYQFDLTWIRYLSKFDAFSLIPLWTFFAPRPGQTDYHLLYRDRLVDGTTNGWQEIEMTDQRTIFSALWNPEKRSKKVLTDVVQLLVEIAVASDNDSAVIVFSTPYVLVLNVVMSATRDENVMQRQFVIAETSGYIKSGDPHVILRSDFHKFTDAAGTVPALYAQSQPC